MKTKHTFYNSLAGLSYYVMTIVLGILNRKAVIGILGIEYQGINGLFGNVLSMLSIAELGIGTAIIYHLYRPLCEGDLPAVKALMQFYKKCYLAVAAVIVLCGLLLIPFLKWIVTDNTTAFPLPVIYIWFLLDSAVSYLFTYKRSILIADQKNYLVAGCDLLYQFAVKLGQIAVLWLTGHFILYLAMMALCRLVENLFINYLSNRYYPFLRERDKLPLDREVLEDIRQKVKGTIFHKIGSFIVLGTDNILISRFLGLAAVGIYSNYFLIINAVKSICSQIITAATASVGHMLAEEDEEKNYRIYTELQLLNGMLINCGATGVFCVATPVIALIFGEDYVVSEFTLFVLSCNFYVQGMRTVFQIFKETAGILYEDRYVPVVESAINIGASLALLYYFGLAGVFMGTILSSVILYVYTYPLLVYRRVLKHSVAEYYRELFWSGATSIICMAAAKTVCQNVILENTTGQILFNSAVAILVGNGFYLAGYMMWKKEAGTLADKVKRLFERKR